VGRVVHVLGEALPDEQVGRALHALAGEPDGPADARDGQRRAQHGPEHLPAGGRQPDRTGQLLGEAEELTVQPEHRQRRVAQQLGGVDPLGHAEAAAMSSK
jgi:hypothetical protein